MTKFKRSIRLRPAVPLRAALLSAALSSAALPGLPLTVQAGATQVAPSAPAAAQTASRSGLPDFRHVFIIILENEGLGAIAGNPQLPALNRLIAGGGLARHYDGVAHPSLPNYVALVSGGTWGAHSDDTSVRFSQDNLALQLERAGRSWATYAQTLPRPGFGGSMAGSPIAYALKHNPLMLFPAIRDTPARAARVMPLENLQVDLDAGRAPTLSIVVPDLCHDMHGAPQCRSRTQLFRTGDAFVGEWAARIMASSAWKEDSALVVTFDEGVNDEGGGGRIATIVVTSKGGRGLTSDTPYTHYSLLRTLEQGWGLPPLGQAAQATPMTDLFGR